MTSGLDQGRASPSPKASRQGGMVQVAGVGMAFLGALILAALVFLATGRGSEMEALGVFPLWAFLFLVLIWRVSNWRQTAARGLALLGTEFLALPLAWLLYQGLPSLSGSDPRLAQTIWILAWGLPLAAALLGGSLLLQLREGGPAPGTRWRALVTVAAAAVLGEALYGLLLLVSLQGV